MGYAMTSDKRRLCMGISLLFFLCMPLAVRAQLSKQNQEAANRMISGALYLRLDVPCKSAVHFYLLAQVVVQEAVLEVSPTGHDATRLMRLSEKEGNARLNWMFFPNDPVHNGKLSFNGDTVKVSMEGVLPNDYKLSIDFIQIKSLEDFTKAFNQTFSKVPLQEEHPEWPAEVRNAIANHRLVVGMTREQAFDVVGTPVQKKTVQLNGIQVETWSTRQDKGQEFGAIQVNSLNKSSGELEGLGVTGFPAQLKFIDGKLQAIW